VATRMQKLKVGAFLVMCVSLAMSAVMIVSGLYQRQGIPYSIEFNESVLGLYEGGIVQYLGVPVGKVATIYVTPNKRAHVEVLVNPEKVTLKDGVEGQLVLYSLATGTMCIQLSGGEQNAKTLPPGAMIPVKPSMITAVSSRVEAIVEDLSTIMSSLSSAVSGMEEGDIAAIVEKVNATLDEVKHLVQNGDDLVGETNKTVTSLRGRAETAVDDFKDLSKDVKKLTKNVDELVVSVRGKVDKFDAGQLQDQLHKTLENISGVTDKLNKAMSQFDNLSANTLHEVDNVQYTLRSSMEEISTTFEHLRVLVDQLKEDPSALVRGKGKKKEDQQ
jgi:phospholipid/cholesterol/gamma-HCH transport system substrate-binding protein